MQLLLDWRSKSEFNRDTDWVWASPYSGGEMPLHFQSMQKEHIVPASLAAGLGKIGWHCLRHTYRAWLNAEGYSTGRPERPAAALQHLDHRQRVRRGCRGCHARVQFAGGQAGDPMTSYVSSNSFNSLVRTIYRDGHCCPVKTRIESAGSRYR